MNLASHLQAIFGGQTNIHSNSLTEMVKTTCFHMEVGRTWAGTRALVAAFAVKAVKAIFVVEAIFVIEADKVVFADAKVFIHAQAAAVAAISGPAASAFHAFSDVIRR